MSQLTIRNFPPQLEKAIRDLARKRRWSLNKAAVYLLGKGAGVSVDGEKPLIGNALDGFFGSWSAEEARAFDARVADAFETVDEDLWK